MQISKLFLTAALFAAARTTYAQDWQMQPVQIQTPWAAQVSPKNALPEYPRPQLARSNWQNLNGLWDYTLSNLQDARPQSYTGKILVPFPFESALSGVKGTLKPYQWLWYKRDFTQNLKGRDRLLLHFGAATWQTRVYINGKPVGEHKGGYDSFDFDITAATHSGSNTIEVSCWNASMLAPNAAGKQFEQPQSIWYTKSSGIWQTVWLEEVPEVSIDKLKLTPDIDQHTLAISVGTKGDAAGYSIEAIAKAGGKIVGKLVTQPNAPGQLAIGGNLHLWSPGDPYLYGLTVKLLHNGQVIDTVGSYFGMRKIAIKKDADGVDRIFLNNQFTYNLGVLDQGFWPEGIYTAPTDSALAWDVRTLKAMGFNTIRKHIKVEPARWYYDCDRTGMLVWQDMPSRLAEPADDNPEARQQFERECQQHVEQLYNYPSIVTWVMFNEGWGCYDQARMTKLIKDLDPSRLVNGHTGENYYDEQHPDLKADWANSDLTDIHAYPDPNIPPGYRNKARVVGEFGGISVGGFKGHEWSGKGGWGYTKETPESFAKRYADMVGKLVKFKQMGLSGSIYTQPYDVELEENGLYTYDRKVIKIPADTLKKINSQLVP